MTFFGGDDVDHGLARVDQSDARFDVGCVTGESADRSEPDVAVVIDQDTKTAPRTTSQFFTHVLSNLPAWSYPKQTTFFTLSSRILLSLLLPSSLSVCFSGCFGPTWYVVNSSSVESDSGDITYIYKLTFPFVFFFFSSSDALPTIPLTPY